MHAVLPQYICKLVRVDQAVAREMFRPELAVQCMLFRLGQAVQCRLFRLDQAAGSVCVIARQAR